MLAALAFLPLTAVLIQDVRAESTPSAVTIDVATSEPVSRDDVRGVTTGGRRIWVYVQGSSAARPAFGSGDRPIFVYPRSRYTKLEIPTRTRCVEPLAIETTPSGVRVRAACGDDATAGAALPPPVRAADGEGADKPSPEAPLAAKARTRAETDSLRAALALPREGLRGDTDSSGDEEAARRADKVKGEAKAQKASANDGKRDDRTVTPEQAVKAAAPAAGTAVAATSTGPDAPVAGLSVVESPSASATARSGESKPPSAAAPGAASSAMSTILAGVLLAGLAVAAILFARRRTTRTRMIKIIETASIGPRRSLVVANVGGRTMVLGVSEAGVALLDAPVSPAPIEPTGAPAAVTDSVPPQQQSVPDLRALVEERSEPERSIQDVSHESSLLSRLFHRQPPSSSPLSSRDFEDLLSESLEDQELRRKLSLGESGRVA